jgi:hypothetical protein
VAHFEPWLIANQVFGKPILSFVRAQIDDSSGALHSPENWRGQLELHVRAGNGFTWWENPGNFSPSSPGMQEMIDIATQV